MFGGLGLEKKIGGKFSNLGLKTRGTGVVSAGSTEQLEVSRWRACVIIVKLASRRSILAKAVSPFIGSKINYTMLSSHFHGAHVYVEWLAQKKGICGAASLGNHLFGVFCGGCSFGRAFC
jgi:hypothetical protein